MTDDVSGDEFMALRPNLPAPHEAHTGCDEETTLHNEWKLRLYVAASRGNYYRLSYDKTNHRLFGHYYEVPAQTNSVS
jgi:hypothetical protein